MTAAHAKDLLGVDLDVGAWPLNPPVGWWIRIASVREG